MDIGGAELSIFSMTLITIVRLYYFSIANFKALSICISIGYSWTFEDTIAEPRDYCESLCTGTYSIAIYCRYSLDFIIGYFKIFSNSISNFDFYGISIDFGDDNSKTFDDGSFNSFEDGVAEL